MNPLWHLVWAIPLAIVLGLIIASYLPWSKGPEGPPYVGFDDKLDEYLRKTGRDESWGGLPSENVQRAEDVIIHHARIHSRAEGQWRDLMREAENSPHLGRPCSPQCWRDPDGHRRGTS